MKLSQLMQGVSCTTVQGSTDVEINDIIYDSRRQLRGSYLFVSLVPSGTAMTMQQTALQKASAHW